MAASKSLCLSNFLTSLPSISPSPSSCPPASFVSLPLRSDDLSKSASLSVQSPIIAINPKSPSSSSPGIANALSSSVGRANVLFFKSAYNVQVIPGENEPEEKLLSRFKREVFRAGVMRECRRRRFFENRRERTKRKAKDAAAARKNRRRPPQPKSSTKAVPEVPNEKKENEADDNWDLYDVELPY